MTAITVFGGFRPTIRSSLQCWYMLLSDGTLKELKLKKPIFPLFRVHCKRKTPEPMLPKTPSQMLRSVQNGFFPRTTVQPFMTLFERSRGDTDVFGLRHHHG